MWEYNFFPIALKTPANASTSVSMRGTWAYSSHANSLVKCSLAIQLWSALGNVKSCLHWYNYTKITHSSTVPVSWNIGNYAFNVIIIIRGNKWSRQSIDVTQII